MLGSEPVSVACNAVTLPSVPSMALALSFQYFWEDLRLTKSWEAIGSLAAQEEEQIPLSCYFFVPVAVSSLEELSTVYEVTHLCIYSVRTKPCTLLKSTF